MEFVSWLFVAIFASIIIFFGIGALTGNLQIGEVEYVEKSALQTNVQGFLQKFLDDL